MILMQSHFLQERGRRGKHDGGSMRRKRVD